MQINIFRQWLEPLNSVEINYESLLNESNSTNGASLKQIKAQLQIKSDIDISFKAYPAISLLSAKIQNLKSEVIPALIEDGYQKWIDPNWSDFDRDNSLFAGHQAA